MANHCIDCNVVVGKASTRCRSCAAEIRRKPKVHCMDCGEEIGRTSTRCRLCACKDPERSRKLSEKLTGKKLSKEHIQSISETLTGHKHSEETKQKIGDAVRNPSEETRQKMRKAKLGFVPWNKGKTGIYSEEVLGRISQSVTRAWQDGVYDDRKVVVNSPTGPEEDIMTMLDKSGIEYQFQFPIKCYRYDFYLPGHKILIEYDGWPWHHSDWALELGLFARDKKKDILARESGLRLIRLTGFRNRDLTYDEIYSMLVEELRNEIAKTVT